MLRLHVALFVVSVTVAQTGSVQPNTDPPAATAEQIADLTAKLDQIKALVQTGKLKDAYRLNMKLAAELGKLSIRVLTPEQQLLNCEELMAKQPRARIAFLPMAARFSLEAGQLDKAGTFARELLQLSEAEPPGNISSLHTHAAHILLGRVALQRTHDVATAKAELLAAARVSSFVGMQRFGPNMSLARDLLASGEQPTVLEYLRLFSNLSPEAMAKISEWAKLIQSGAIPDFGANTMFYL